MDIKVDIKNIYLGKASAENEIDELHNYFVSTKAYLNAKDEKKKKLFYIAHRGSGKSALFNQLIYENSSCSNKIILQINPAEYSYETFTKLKHKFYDIKASYSLAWEYTLMIQLFIEISNFFNKNKNLKRNRENLKIIDDYLLNNKFRKTQTRLEIFLDFLSRIDISKVNIKYKGFEVSTQQKESATKQLVSLYNLDDIRRPLNALEQITLSHPIYLYIDELDTGWNNTKEARNYISGLITASLKINSIKGVEVYLSLRQDMYNNLALAFNDAEKIRDEIEYINWNHDSLTAIICKRITDNNDIKNQTSHLNYISQHEILSLIFEEGAFDYLLSNTLYRPREVIHYCNLAITKYYETYITRKLFNKRIDIETIDLVSGQFSTDRFNDFCAEFNHEFPSIKILLANFEGGFAIYPKDSFLNKLEECMLDFMDEIDIENNSLIEKEMEPIDTSWIKPYLDNPDKLIIKLFDIGFLKVSYNGDDFFAYYEKKPQSFKNINQVKLNKVFSIALGCVEKAAPNILYK